MKKLVLAVLTAVSMAVAGYAVGSPYPDQGQTPEVFPEGSQTPEFTPEGSQTPE